MRLVLTLAFDGIASGLPTFESVLERYGVEALSDQLCRQTGGAAFGRSASIRDDLRIARQLRKPLLELLDGDRSGQTILAEVFSGQDAD